MDKDIGSNDSVFLLLTHLCNNLVKKNFTKHDDNKKINIKKLRSQSYETLLFHKRNCLNDRLNDPVQALAVHYTVACQNALDEYRYHNLVRLRQIITELLRDQTCAKNEIFRSALKLLLRLSREYKSKTNQRVFTFGVLEKLLPYPKRELFGSPQPYPYYPSHIFKLNFPFEPNKGLINYNKPIDYSIDVTNSSLSSLQKKSVYQQPSNSNAGPNFFGLMPLTSLVNYATSSSLSSIQDIPRLKDRRDLSVPKITGDLEPFTSTDPDFDEFADLDWYILIRKYSTSSDFFDDPPLSNSLQAMPSSQKMCLWQRNQHCNLFQYTESATQKFLNDAILLMIGIKTDTFYFDEEKGRFYINKNVNLGNCESNVNYLLEGASLFKWLEAYAFDHRQADLNHLHETVMKLIRKYILEYRLKIRENVVMCNRKSCSVKRINTLMQLVSAVRKPIEEVKAIVHLITINRIGNNVNFLKGRFFMSKLYRHLSNSRKCPLIVLNAIITMCVAYFKLIEKFIFEAELDETYDIFFIEKQHKYLKSRNKKYWSSAFTIPYPGAVPTFFESMANNILLCGKTLKLYKSCNPKDPILKLMAIDHPSVKCCVTLDEIARQQEILEIYTTRCLFIGGQRLTFEQILLKKERERYAFAEMAAVKQAETMKKIIDEQRRYREVVASVKQHSFKVLEALMVEAKASKIRKYQDKVSSGVTTEKSFDDVDANEETERDKIRNYYSKLNNEIEKNKNLTEWKLKRLQLDPMRLELLSAEERNLKIEKLEINNQLDNTETDKDLINQNVCDNSNLVNTKETSNINKNATNNNIGSGNTVNTVKLDQQGNIITNTDLYNNPTIDSDNITENQASYYDSKHQALLNKIKVLSHEFDSTNNNIKELINEPKIDNENNLVLTASDHAKLNRIKAQSSDNELKEVYKAEPCTDAQKEAVVNRNKILGTEYNLAPEAISLREAVNDAQKSAVYNKKKMLSSHNELEKVSNHEPCTEAQKEAVINRQKVLGTEYNLAPIAIILREAVNDAQISAVDNKKHILGSDIGYNASGYSSHTDVTSHVKSASSAETLDINLQSSNNELQEASKRKPCTEAQKEAVLNKQKVLGTEYNLAPTAITPREAISDAQIIAVDNKKHMLGSDIGYKSDKEKASSNISVTSHLESGSSSEVLKINLQSSYKELQEALERKPCTEAQKEAVLNKQKVLGTEYNLAPIAITPREAISDAQIIAVDNKKKMLGSDIGYKSDKYKRPSLSLDLKASNIGGTFDVTPHVESGSPSEIFRMMELQTPGVQDSPFIPNETSSDDNQSVIEENVLDLTCKDEPFLLDNDIVDNRIKDLQSYTEETKHFDPFGLNAFQDFNRDKIKSTHYTSIIKIIEESNKKPQDLFGYDKDFEYLIKDDINMAQLVASLKESILLPLKCQLDVVNNMILSYFLVELDLYEHLRSMRNYFFLVDGNFSLGICRNLFAKLAKSKKPKDLLNSTVLSTVLNEALSTSLASDEKYAERLSFTVKHIPEFFHHSSPAILDSLSLTYSVDWPLNIIISDEVIALYAKIFKFLLKLKRISWVLRSDFEYLKLLKNELGNSRTLHRSNNYISINAYRHLMMSFICVLENYIETTCVHASWCEFEDDLKTVTTLDDLYDTHVIYLRKIAYRMLQNYTSSQLMKIIDAIFVIVLKFSRILRAGTWTETDGSFEHENMAELEEMYKLFKKKLECLTLVVDALFHSHHKKKISDNVLLTYEPLYNHLLMFNRNIGGVKSSSGFQ